MTHDELRTYVNTTPLLLSMLYDINLLPEQCDTDKKRDYLQSIVGHWIEARRAVIAECVACDWLLEEMRK